MKSKMTKFAVFSASSIVSVFAAGESVREEDMQISVRYKQEIRWIQSPNGVMGASLVRQMQWEAPELTYTYNGCVDKHNSGISMPPVDRKR